MSDGGLTLVLVLVLVLVLLVLVLAWWRRLVGLFVVWVVLVSMEHTNRFLVDGTLGTSVSSTSTTHHNNIQTSLWPRT